MKVCFEDSCADRKECLLYTGGKGQEVGFCGRSRSSFLQIDRAKVASVMNELYRLEDLIPVYGDTIGKLAERLNKVLKGK